MSALGEAALVWPLLSVDSQVVEEVVPLPEHLGTLGVGAAEESDDPSSLWAFVLVDDEVLGAWNVFFYSDLMKVEIFPMRNLDELVITNDLPIDELGVDIEVVLLFDLGLGQILRGLLLWFFSAADFLSWSQLS